MEKLHSQKKTMGPPHSRNSLASLPVHDFVAGQAERTKEKPP